MVDARASASCFEAPAVQCNVLQIVGEAEVEACWDFSLTCADKSPIMSEHICLKVKGSAETLVPGEKLKAMARCGGTGDPVMLITNLTINGKPA